MGHYSVDDIEQKLREEYGELEVVLESDRDYTLHLNDTEFNSDDGVIKTRGPVESDEGVEIVEAEFPADAIEHVRGHEHM